MRTSKSSALPSSAIAKRFSRQSPASHRRLHLTLSARSQTWPRTFRTSWLCRCANMRVKSIPWRGCGRCATQQSFCCDLSSWSLFPSNVNTGVFRKRPPNLFPRWSRVRPWALGLSWRRLWRKPMTIHCVPQRTLSRDRSKICFMVPTNRERPKQVCCGCATAWRTAEV